jgi:hypothetical protein
MLPDYRDAVEIGRGAASIVYRAVEVATDRPVALKVLTVAGAARHVVDAFEAEGRALAAVSGHPHIVTLHRVTTTPDGRPLLVLELGHGSYADRLRAEGPQPADRTVAVGIKIAGALETAHRAGILHLDVTPQNVLVTPYGEPALADFGVAAPATATGPTDGVVGFTTQHASPEVLEGAPVSPATDVYGLASTLYQLLTGRAPFAAFEGEAPASVILRILRDPVPPVRLAGVPIALSDILVRALAHDPAERPVRAIDLADALRRVEMASGWAPTIPVVWGEAPVDRTATTPAASAATALGAPGPRSSTLPATDPPPAVARPGGAGAPGERGPSVIQPAASPRIVATPGPTGAGRQPTEPEGSEPLTPLQPVRPDGGPRLLVPPPPPEAGAPSGLRPGPARTERTIRPADTGPTTGRPTWAPPATGVDGPLQRTGIPELRPAAGPGRTLGPPPGPAAGRTPLVVAGGVGIGLLVALAVLFLLGIL